jgi:predicted kinase
MNNTPQIHLIEGPVGAGKSTLANKLHQQYQAPVLNLDFWMATLFSPDRPVSDFVPWYLERKARCIDHIWHVTEGILAINKDVILELGLIQQAQRSDFLDRVEARRYPMSIYVVDAPESIRRERVQMRNTQKTETFAMEVPDAIFDMANALWEPVDEAECRNFRINFIEND